MNCQIQAGFSPLTIFVTFKSPNSRCPFSTNPFLMVMRPFSIVTLATLCISKMLANQDVNVFLYWGGKSNSEASRLPGSEPSPPSASRGVAPSAERPAPPPHSLSISASERQRENIRPPSVERLSPRRVGGPSGSGRCPRPYHRYRVKVAPLRSSGCSCFSTPLHPSRLICGSFSALCRPIPPGTQSQSAFDHIQNTMTINNKRIFCI
ncbi:unnamed protein product [Nesidiocoris tenuis]|uniref:Uncharacterized protein n=1 Tax=Nesidiocoris tenuis TaxID=355587 RepID=A0A6H5FVT4_9HEMI|nr:unnamed protein product [Nesidiocoris tenuis]